jgi:hypothetical protein
MHQTVGNFTDCERNCRGKGSGEADHYLALDARIQTGIGFEATLILLVWRAI